MILEVVQSKWSLTWYDPLGPRMCVLELMNRHVLQTLREQLKVPGSRLEGSKLLTSEFLRFRSHLNNVRLVSNIRQRQSNIRQKLNWRFRRLIFQELNTMHKLCLFTLSRQTSFSALL